jgi:DNA-binding response OmpR family regulator
MLIRSSSASHGFRGGDLVIDMDLHRATRGNAEIELTKMEFDILVCLVKNLNRVVTLAELQETLWGPYHGDYAQTCRMHIANLRKKLGASSGSKALIQTAAGVGYYIEDPSNPKSK